MTTCVSKQDIHYDYCPQEHCLLIMYGSCFKDALFSVHRMRGLVASPGWIWPWARAVFWAARPAAGLPTGPASTQAGGADVSSTSPSVVTAKSLHILH